jgi:hypothetical protein
MAAVPELAGIKTMDAVFDRLDQLDRTRGSQWTRVNFNQRCPICDSATWCLVSPDGTAVICPRTPEGAVKCLPDSGYLHFLKPRNGRLTTSLTVTIPATIDRADLAELAAVFRDAVRPDRLLQLAGRLGVSAESLRRLGIGWSEEEGAWSFPMTDAQGRMRGIRLRSSSGQKFAVKGGHEGLFIPENQKPSRQLLITEGPTDLAAILDLGFTAIGRPNCTGGKALILELIQAERPAEVAIMSDRDEHGRGLAGALDLAGCLALYVPRLRVLLPPEGIKDVRDWVRSGANRQTVLDAIEKAPARKLILRSDFTSPSSNGG